MGIVFLLAIGACAPLETTCVPATKDNNIVYVVEHGWHAEIGIPVEALDRSLGFVHDRFPGAKYVMFGYGKRTFWTAPPHSISEYVLGPFPGPGLIQMVGLNTTPLEAYDSGDTVQLELPPGGAHLLSAYIDQDLVKNDRGEPVIVATSTSPAGLFYAVKSEYNIMHTCNTWTADALRSAGWSISSGTVVFSGQVMSRVDDLAESQCASIR